MPVFQTLQSISKSFFYHVMDFISPPSCIVCGEGVSWSDKGVCKACRETFEEADTGCEVCGQDSESCFCQERSWYPEATLVAYEYTGGVRRVVAVLKKGEGLRALDAIAAYRFAPLLERVGHIDMVVPVPRNRWKPGKVHVSELVAKRAASVAHSQVKRVIQSQKRKEQKKLHRWHRLMEVQGKFTVKSGREVKDKTILLVDDVLTTGATINESARVLYNKGAKKVFCLIVARSPIKKLENNIYL